MNMCIAVHADLAVLFSFTQTALARPGLCSLTSGLAGPGAGPRRGGKGSKTAVLTVSASSSRPR